MKTKLKTTLALLAAFCGLHAFAATPIAVWDGNYGEFKESSLTKTVGEVDYTMTVSGTTASDGSSVTVTSDGGLTVKFYTKGTSTLVGSSPFSVIIKYSNLSSPTADNTAYSIIDLYGSSDEYRSYVGMAMSSDGGSADIWGKEAFRQDSVSRTANELVCSSAGSKKAGFAFTSNNKTDAFVPSGTAYNSTTFKSSQVSAQGFSVGSNNGGTAGSWFKTGFTKQGDLAVPAGMVITGVAIFSSHITAAEFSAYVFPSEMTGESAGTIPTVAYWNKDFANNYNKGGYTVSYGAGATLNADGTVSLTQQSTTGTRTDGVVVDFCNGGTSSVLSGKQMTVIVKYSGLTCSTAARTVLFSTKWGTASKDTTEVVIVRTWDGKLAMGYGITANGDWANEQMGSTATFPTAGLMMISCSGSGGCAGTRVGFAPLQNDGTYGDFVDVGFKSGVKYSNPPFYGIKIGGTQGNVSTMTRPGMKVEGVAIIQGVTSTMKTFKYLFPDECVARYDWAQSGNLTTTATTLINNMPLKAVTNAVYAGKMQSVDWPGSMLTACFKKFTLTEGEPTSMTLQYQHLDPSNSKAVDATVAKSGNDLTIVRSGAHYKGTGDIGTDDAGWTSSSDSYNVSTLSVYVPATKTATLSGGTVAWKDISWTGGAPTAEDFVMLKVTAPTILTLSSTDTMAAARIISTPNTKLTIKYNEGAFEALREKGWDFTYAAGGVSIDVSAVGPELVKYAVVGAPHSLWISKTSGGVQPTAVLPSMSGYTFATETVSGFGTRIVVTASSAKFGSIGLNFMGNTSKATSTDDAKVGTLTTNVGVHPAIGTSWNDLEGKNQTSTAVTKYVDSTGATVTTGNMSVTVAGVNNTYGTDAAAHSLFYGYLDDGGSPNVTIGNIPFSKYRVVVYSTTDNGNYGMNAAQIGLTSSSIRYCYGPNYRGDAGATLFDSSAKTWGNSGSRTDCIEGVNCVISDVLEGNSAYVKMTRASNDRGCICAIQIVEVDVVASVDGKGYGTLAAAEVAVQSGGTIKLLTDCSESLTTAKTFTLDLNGKTLGGTLNVEAEGVVTLNYNDGTLSSTVTGSGTIVYNGVIPTTVPTGITANAWTGTVWLENKTGIGELELNVWGNANSTIRLTGIQAYFNTTAHKEATVTFPGTLEVTNTDSTGAAKDYALDINNGWSGATVAFGALKGDGLIKDTTKSATQTFTFDDVSEFAGSITLSHVKFKFGTGDATLSSGSVVVTAAGSATVASGKTWTTGSNGIKVNGKIGGAGTLASNTTFGDGAEIDARTAQLTANGTLTFGANTKVRVATAPTVETPIKVFNKTGSGFVTTVTVYVGDSTTAESGTFKLFYKDNGIYVTPYTTHTIEMTADTTWADLISGKTIGANDDVVVTAGGHKLTFTEKVTATYRLTINGNVTIAAWDALYVDGCWEETIATFGQVSIPGTITSELKTGFNGAFTTTANSIKLRAQNKEVISINIAGGKGGGTGQESEAANLVTGTDFYGIAPTLGDSWNNINRRWQDGGNQTITINSPNAYDGQTTIQRPTMSLSATGKNTWNCDSIANKFLRGYLDDGNGVTVMVHGIPYTKYDVIVYSTSDSAARLAPVTINGTKYTFADGETKPGATVWGQGEYATPEIGKNALRINNCEGGTLTINAVRVWTPDGRATLCAVQVINKGEVVISSKYVADVTAENVTWTNGEDEGLTKRSIGEWANSQLSTLTLTNTVASTLTFNPAQVLTGLTFKVVSAADYKMTIPYASLEKLSFTYLDFSEAFGKVEIDMSSVTEGSERVILAGELTGPTNVTYTSTGDWGAYADATGIHMAPKAHPSRNNPVTGEATTFERSFFGSANASWNTLANWRTVSNGIWVPATKIPGISGSSGDEYPKIMIDGDDSAQDTVTVNTLEGYNIQYAFLNGAQVTASTLTKMQGSGVTQFIWVDGTSSFKVNALGDNQNWGTVDLYVAAENGITFPAFNKGATLNYYFTNNASVKFTGAVTAGTHTFKSISLEVGTDNTKPARHVAKKTLVTLGAAGTTVTFAKADDIVVSLDNKDVTPTYKDNVTVMDAVGTYTIKTESTGVYAYVVQYADQWDVMDPATATISAGTTDWTTITWTDAFPHQFTGLTGAHEYQVTAADGATLNFNAAVPAKAVKLINNANETVTLTKGEEVTAQMAALDFSQVAGTAIADFDVGAANVTAGVNTIVRGGGTGTLTIGADKTTTITNGVWAGTVTRDNASTLRYAGTAGTTSVPYVNGDSNTGLVIYAADFGDLGTGGLQFANTLTRKFENGFVVTGGRFVLGNNASHTQNITMDGGSITVTGNTAPTASTASTLFAHYDSTVNFTMNGGTFTAENAAARIGWDGKAYVTVAGGTFRTKGIKSGSERNNAGSFTLSGGTLELGDFGIQALGSAAPYTFSGGTVKSYANTSIEVKHASGLQITGPVTFDAAGGTIAINGKMTLTGSITVQGGLVRFADYRGFVTLGEGGTVGYPIDINDAGVFTVPTGMDATKITLYKADGTAITPTKTESGKIYYESSMEDFSAYWKYEFEGNGNNTGTEGTALSWDNDRPFKDNEYVTDEKTGKKSLRVPTRPHRTVSTWPEAATFVMYGTMVGGDNHYQICFGTKSGNLLFLATGDTSKNEVVLCKSTNNTPVPLCTMTVPNAQTTKHLYAFVLKKVGDKSAIDIYLDGALLQPYTFDSEFTLGGGFQIASPHGGPVTGYERTADNDPALLDFLRVYDKELNSDAVAKYAEEYPYHSPFGTYTRDLNGTEGTWVQEGQWKSNDTAVVVSEPGTNSVLQISATAATGLAVNLAESKTYENVTFGGDGAIAVTNDMVNSGKVKAKGRITVNTNTRLAIDAFETYGSAISIGNGKVLTLDLGNADISKYWSSQSIDLTGAIICNDYATQVKIEQPKTVKAPRTVTIRIDDASKHAWADIYVPTNDIIGTVSGGNITWSWANTAIDEADIDFDQTEVAIKIVMGENQDFTLNEKYAKADLITVNGGNLNIGTNRNMTVAGKGTVDVQLTEEESSSTTELTLFNVTGTADLAFRTVTDYAGQPKTDFIGGNGKIIVNPPATTLTGLHILRMMPKATSRTEDRDPNGRDSGWIDLINYGPAETNLANYQIIRTNLGKEYKTKVGKLLSRTVAKGQIYRIYTSEEYPTAEDYGGDGKTVKAYAKNGEGIVVEDANGIIIVPTKVNPKKYPMVRLVEGTTNIIDEVIVPNDLDDNMQIEVVANADKLERKVVYPDGRATVEYGPAVDAVYGIDGVKSDLKLLNKAKFATVGADYKVVFPVNPFKTGSAEVLDANTITNVVLEYRVFDSVEANMPVKSVTNLVMSTATSEKEIANYGAGCQLWTGKIPAEAMVAGKLVQFRAKIFDKGGKVWTAPRNLNPDIGHIWYGVVAQPETTTDPSETTKVCTANLDTYLMFVSGYNITEMDKDIDSQDKTKVPYGARCAIYDAKNGVYYDNVRIDLRGQTSRTFTKKSHGLRFSKIAPLKCADPFTGVEYELRKTSFIAEYGDPAYIRQTLALRVMRTAGVKAPFNWPSRLYRNGTYYQLAFNSNRFTDEAVEDIYGLNKYGYAYKNVGELLSSGWASTGTEKKTPDDDVEKGTEAMAVISAYADRFNDAHAADRTAVAMKEFNIPAWINYLAATKITQECDDVWTNLGIYIDKYEYFLNKNGDDTIRPLAYDQNLSFGVWYYGDDTDRGRIGIVATNDTMKSHPLYGGKEILYHKADTGKSTINRWNRGMETIYQNETYRNAMVRRLRTLMEVFYGSNDATQEETPIWQWATEYWGAIEADVPVDHSLWQYNQEHMQSNVSAIWVWTNAMDLAEAKTDLWNNFIVPHRNHLFVTHAASSIGTEKTHFTEIGYAATKSAGIPETQTATATLKGGISLTTSEGTKIVTGETKITDGIVGIQNTNNEAIDMSYWQLDGVATLTFAPGTVLPAGTQANPGKLWIVLDRRAAASKIAESNIPMIINVDKNAGETVSGEPQINLKDAEGNVVETCQFYITITTVDEKTVAVVSYEPPVGGTETQLPMDWMVEHGIDTKGNAAQLSTNMNVKVEGGNGATPWESYALGLAPEDPESKPVIAPVQTSDKDNVTFKLTNVDGAGADTKNFNVQYRVWAGSTPGAKEGEPSATVGYDATQSMPLPNEGVKYYTIEVITTQKPATP